MADGRVWAALQLYCLSLLGANYRSIRGMRVCERDREARMEMGGESEGEECEQRQFIRADGPLRLPDALPDLALPSLSNPRTQRNNCTQQRLDGMSYTPRYSVFSKREHVIVLLLLPINVAWVGTYLPIYTACGNTLVRSEVSQDFLCCPSKHLERRTRASCPTSKQS